MGKLDNKIAVVTGSSVGIGRAIAEAFSAEGAEVIIVSHKTIAEGKSVAQEIMDKGGKAMYVCADLSSQKGVDSLFNEISKHYSRIDVLVNNVGHSFNTPFDELSEETITRDLNSNLLATVLCSKKVLEYMPNGGHIINTSSIRGLDYAGRVPLIGYCAGKAAVNSFTKNFAVHCAPKIFVNAIAPGFVWTEAFSATDKALLDKWEKAVPIQRFIKPDELAELYVVLATTHILTGVILSADGGYTILEK